MESINEITKEDVLGEIARIDEHPEIILGRSSCISNILNHI